MRGEKGLQIIEIPYMDCSSTILWFAKGFIFEAINLDLGKG